MIVVGNGLAPFRLFVADDCCRERPCAVPFGYVAEGVTPCGDPGQAQGPAPTQISLPAGWRTGISHEWWQIKSSTKVGFRRQVEPRNLTYDFGMVINNAKPWSRVIVVLLYLSTLLARNRDALYSDPG